MTLVVLAAILLPAQTPTNPHADQWKRAVEIHPEIKLNKERVEVITVRMKIKPDHFVYAAHQPDEIFRTSEPKLTVKSKHPGTRVEVHYPKGITANETLAWTRYEGEFAVTAVVRRAKGDDSPLECTLRFHPMQRGI